MKEEKYTVYQIKVTEINGDTYEEKERVWLESFKPKMFKLAHPIMFSQFCLVK